jgi:hypothetical protein
VSDNPPDEPTATPPENPAPEGQHVDAEARRRLDEHDNALGELTALVTAAITVKGDSSPVKKPWTHRKIL